jgi:probable rRNA maturation factor
LAILADPCPENISVWHTHTGRALSKRAVRQLAWQVLNDQKVSWDYVGIVLSRREMIHALNREHLGHDYPTDVLSFPITDSRLHLEGEVYVDLDTAAENAIRFQTTFRREAARYIIHGLLHLAGYDDASEESRAIMRNLEGIYLQRYWDGMG